MKRRAFFDKAILTSNRTAIDRTYVRDNKKHAILDNCRQRVHRNKQS